MAQNSRVIGAKLFFFFFLEFWNFERCIDSEEIPLETDPSLRDMENNPSKSPNSSRCDRIGKCLEIRTSSLTSEKELRRSP